MYRLHYIYIYMRIYIFVFMSLSSGTDTFLLGIDPFHWTISSPPVCSSALFAFILLPTLHKITESSRLLIDLLTHLINSL